MAERNAPSPFDQAFAELDAALIDLDGDGIPDVQVPRNALAVPQRMVPRGAQPIAPGFEMLPSEAPQAPGNALMGGGVQTRPANAADRGADEMMPRYAPFPAEAPPPAPPNPWGTSLGSDLGRIGRGVAGGVGSAVAPVGNWLSMVGRDIASDPLGAISGAGQWNPMAGMASRAAPIAGEIGSTANALMRGPRRAFTEAEGQAFQAAKRVDDADWASMPAHLLQERNGNLFGKMPAHIKEARQRAREVAAQDKRATRAFEKRFGEKPKYDEDGALIPPNGWTDLVHKIDR